MNKKFLPAHQNEYDLSIALTIYNTGYYQQKTTNRNFFLRNLNGSTQDPQIEHAKLIVEQVAQELHYLTGFGLDKGVVKSGSTKVAEIIFPDLRPKLDKMAFFHALLFQFAQPACYRWVMDGRQSSAIMEDRLAEGWERKLIISRKNVSFRLPVITLIQPDETGYMSFFRWGHSLKQKWKRKDYGFTVFYDREDPIFTSFMNRFQPDGHPAFGDRQYFNSENGSVYIVGRKWPPSKAKPKKLPRKSRLASQPTDNTEYVYIIQAGRTHNYKIGKSNDPQGRLDSLQTANPQKLKLLHIFTADNASAAEEELHRLLHKSRMEGEWFRLTPAQRDVLVSVQQFQEGQFWINKTGIAPNDLFTISE